jgi:hypothetical protein
VKVHEFVTRQLPTKYTRQLPTKYTRQLPTKYTRQLPTKYTRQLPTKYRLVAQFSAILDHALAQETFWLWIQGISSLASQL